MSKEAPLLFARRIALGVLGMPIQTPPTLQSLLTEYAYTALNALPNPQLVESLVIVRTKTVEGGYEYSVQAKACSDQKVTDVKGRHQGLLDVLLDFAKSLDLTINETRKRIDEL